MAQKQLTNPLPNVISPIARVEVTVNGKKAEGKAFIIPPWNSFFQQFVQQAPAALEITLDASPFSITPNAQGMLSVNSGTVSSVILTRGNINITISGDARSIIPIRIGDIVTITYSVAPTVYFLPN